jgi:hypothetical protein
MRQMNPKGRRKRIERRGTKERENSGTKYLSPKRTLMLPQRRITAAQEDKKTKKSVICEDANLHVSTLGQLRQDDVFVPVCSQSASISRRANEVTYVSNP